MQLVFHSLNTIMVYKGYYINIENMFKLINMKAHLYSLNIKFVLWKDSVLELGKWKMMTYVGLIPSKRNIK
jgi:hypothetical protein